jgi:hypothetical protein
VLARDAGGIRLNDVFRLFVFGKEAALASEETAVKRLVSKVLSSVDDQLDLTLKDLFATGAAARAARIA